MIALLRRPYTAAPLGRLGWLRPSFGALLGIALTGALCRAWVTSPAALPFLIAPMGASAVLLFAVPASPLAQPWSIFGGNTLSALAGVTAGMVIDDRVYASGVAIAAAIAVMSLTRCIHPPGGAVALTAVIGGSAITSAGWSFVLVPVALNTALLVGIGLLFNNATRHRYPHRPAVIQAVVQADLHGTADPPPQERLGSVNDIDAVLARYDELLDVSREDLVEIFRRVETQTYRRLHGEIRCGQIMSRDVVSVAPTDTVADATACLREHRLNAMPVLDEAGRVLGVVRYPQLLEGGTVVADVIATPVCLSAADAPIDELLPALSNGVFHEAFVIDGGGRLLGMVTQTDLLAALWRTHVAEQVATGLGVG